MILQVAVSTKNKQKKVLVKTPKLVDETEQNAADQTGREINSW